MSAFTDHLPRPAQPALPVTRRAATVDAGAAFLLIAATMVFAVVAPPGRIDPAVVVVAVAAYVAASKVSFSVRSGSSTALPLGFVPMWFLLPPAALPVVAIAGQLCVWGLDGFGGGARRAAGALAAVADAWHAMGPALLLALLGAPEPSMALLPVLAVGAALQLALHAGVAAARARWSGAPVEGRPVRAVAGDAAVDLGLAPLGLVVAVVMQEALWPVLLVAPFLAVLARFAGERERRAEHAHHLAEAYRGTAALMADVLEADDHYTGGEHTEGVVAMAVAVGRELGLDAVRTQHLELGALLHDIGKLRIPNEIINKPGKLDAAEWALVQEHPAHGEAMLRRVGGLLDEVAPIVRGHHERFDGGGYPDGLVGEAIPLEARVITVCDSFSAMTTTRSYRKAMSQAEAVAELHRCTPGQFDPGVVEALVATLGETATQGLRLADPVGAPMPAPVTSRSAGQGARPAARTAAPRPAQAA